MNWIKPDWPAPTHIHAAVTLRSGGVSTGNFASLNPASHVQDIPEHVTTNRQIIKDGLNLPAEPIWLQQVHGVNVVKADLASAVETADASYTAQRGVVCTVLTADCLPVLFCGDDGQTIAAAHAGWRGLQAGILEATIKAMQCQKVLVWFGPAIGPDHFEVGDEVRDAFVSADTACAVAFRRTLPNKWLANIYQLASIRLHRLGIGQIYGGNLCTVADPQRFYSYRRDGQATGRMASLIWSE
jgi:YfiH family protein